MDSLDVSRIVASDDTVSNKIRALAAGGVPRAEIARLLGKRYQHVRNVLEGDKLAAYSPGVSEGEPAPFRLEPDVRPPEATGSGRFRLEVDGSGRLVLPSELVKAWGLKAGSVLMGRHNGDTFELVTGKTALRRAQALVRRFIPEGGPSLADELIADRRREVEREDRGD